MPFAVLLGATYSGLVQIPSLPDQYQRQPYLFIWMTAVSVFVVAFHCALGLAAPTAMMFGTGVGVRLRVLIKGKLEGGHLVSIVVKRSPKGHRSLNSFRQCGGCGNGVAFVVRNLWFEHLVMSE